eukprot:6202880-Pleurochrysis_carterae.AAC.2
MQILSFAGRESLALTRRANQLARAKKRLLADASAWILTFTLLTFRLTREARSRAELTSRLTRGCGVYTSTAARATATTAATNSTSSTSSTVPTTHPSLGQAWHAASRAE